MSEPKMTLRDFYFWVKGCVEHNAVRKNWGYYAYQLAADILAKARQVDADVTDGTVTETREKAWMSEAWGDGVDDVAAAKESKAVVENARLLSEGSGS